MLAVPMATRGGVSAVSAPLVPIENRPTSALLVLAE